MLKKLHHVAYRCMDAERTKRFYTEVLGLKLAAALSHDYVPSLSREEPHAHIFFEMEDGSYIAFFDILEDKGPFVPQPDDWAQHLALEVEDDARAELVVERLKAAGVAVLGPVDHGFCISHYFRDPDGHRLEVAVRSSNGDWKAEEEQATSRIDEWQARKVGAASTK